MTASQDEALLDHVMRRLRDGPALVRTTYFGGRTLLHGAASAGCLPAVELLLDLGAAVGAADGSGRTPLFGVANECCGGAAAPWPRCFGEGRRGHARPGQALHVPMEPGRPYRARDRAEPLRATVDSTRGRVPRRSTLQTVPSRAAPPAARGATTPELCSSSS